jgi:hypothetical protein
MVYHNTKSNIVAEKLPLAGVGPGFIELKNPARFACVYEILGGLNPMVDDMSNVRGIIAAFDSGIQQLKAGEEVQVILRRKNLDPASFVKSFKDSCRAEAPEGFKNYFNSYFEYWIDDFIRMNRLCRYEVYLLFAINEDTAPLTDSFFSNITKFASKDKDARPNSDNKLKEVRRRSLAWANNLGVSGVRAREMSEEEILHLLYSELNLKDYTGDIRHLKTAPSVSGGTTGFETIREALCAEPVYNGNKYVQVGEKFLRTMFISNFPDFGKQPHFLSQFLSEPNDFKISLFIKGIDQEYAKASITAQLKLDLATGQKGTTRNYESDANAVERDGVLQTVAQRETGLAKCSLYVTVYGDSSENLSNNYDNFTSRFNGIHRFDGYFQQEELFFSSLPFCTNLLAGVHERLHTTRSIANCWPFFQDDLTSDDGAIIGYTAGREVVKLNPWSRNTDNFNIGVFGSPGTGKSFLIQIIENRLQPTGPQVMIIDKSGAYQTSCRVAGGEYIFFDLRCEKHINPLDVSAPIDPKDKNYYKTGEVSNDHQESVLGFMTTILVESGETALRNIEEALINEAIKLTYSRKFKETKGAPGGPKAPLLRDLRAVLHDMGKEKDRSELAREGCIRFYETLSQYVDEGQYANLTDRDTNIDLEARFIVFDTSLASKREKLDTLITYIISQYCMQRAMKNKTRGLFSWIILDEAWSLLAFPAGRKFGEILSRTSRHLDTCNIWATQLIQDGLKNPEARSLFNNAATKIFMKLGDEDKRICAETFELNEKEVSIVGNLHQVKNVYSQCYLKSSNRKGLIYITPDPVVKWIATSWGYDKGLRKKYLEHIDPDNTIDGTWKAIFSLVQDEGNNFTPDFVKERHNG